MPAADARWWRTLNTASNSAIVYDASIEDVELRIVKLQRDDDRYAKLLEKKASTDLVIKKKLHNYRRGLLGTRI